MENIITTTGTGISVKRHLSIHPSINPSNHPSIHPSLPPYIHTSPSSIHPYNFLFIPPSLIHPYIHLSIHPPSIHLFIYPYVGPYVHTCRSHLLAGRPDGTDQFQGHRVRLLSVQWLLQGQVARLGVEADVRVALGLLHLDLRVGSQDLQLPDDRANRLTLRDALDEDAVGDGLGTRAQSDPFNRSIRLVQERLEVDWRG